MHLDPESEEMTLEARFRVLGFDVSEVALTVDDASAAVSADADRLPQWDILGVSAVERDTTVVGAKFVHHVSGMTVRLDVERRSFFMMRLVVVPLVLIVILSWGVFWMDRSSLGDRMSVSFVGILTAVSYQVLVSGVMPRLASVTFIHALLSLSFLIMVLTVAVNLRVGALDKRGEAARGDRLDRRCRWLFPLAYALVIGFSALYTLG